MDKREVKHPDRAASTGAYSDGVILDGWLYVSGQGPLDLRTGKVVSGDIAVETRLTMSNIGKILEAAGCSFEDVVKCTCHLADIRDFDAFNGVYAEFFRGIRPASAMLVITGLLDPRFLVEIEADAVVPAG